MTVMLAAPPLPLTDEQRAELERIARASSMPHRTVMQAKALLLAAEGVANYEIARRLDVNANSVRTWRRRVAGPPEARTVASALHPDQLVVAEPG